MNGVERTATNHPPGDQGKEALHLIEPGTAGGREMKMEPLPLLGFQPALYRLAVVVQDQVDFLIGGKFLLQVVEKLDELAAPMARQAGPDHLAVQDIEGGE